MNISKWLQENTQGLCGKRVAITGSTGGLGGVLSAYLAELGASLVLLDRNEKRSLAHREQLLARFPHISVDCVRLDLENLVDAEAAVGLLLLQMTSLARALDVEPEYALTRQTEAVIEQIEQKNQ